MTPAIRRMSDPLDMGEFPDELFVVCTSDRLYCVRQGQGLFMAVFAQRDAAEARARRVVGRFGARLVTAEATFDMAREIVGYMKGVDGLVLMGGPNDTHIHWVD